MKRSAFTLVELLVVIAILGLLSTVAVVSLSSSRMNARNTKRKADLVQISKALELYYSDNGGYPPTVSGQFWGICSGNGGAVVVKGETGAEGWIPGLSPTYMATLPRDPNTGRSNPLAPDSNCVANPTWNCYAYRSNGTDYKLLALCGPEGSWSSSVPFYDAYRPSYAWAVYTPGGIAW